MSQAALTSEPKMGHLIRKCRKQSGMTLQALGDKAGVSVGYLSLVERDHATPSLATLAQIARALDVGLEYFVSTPKPVDSLTRADRRPRFSISETGVSYETLGTKFPGAELSSYIIHTPPGYVSEVSQHEGEEFIYILEGEIEQTVGEETFVMHQGDSLHFRGSVPHSWKNATDKPARILWTGALTVLQNTGARRPPNLPPA